MDGSQVSLCDIETIDAPTGDVVTVVRGVIPRSPIPLPPLALRGSDAARIAHWIATMTDDPFAAGYATGLDPWRLAEGIMLLPGTLRGPVQTLVRAACEARLVMAWNEETGILRIESRLIGEMEIVVAASDWRELLAGLGYPLIDPVEGRIPAAVLMLAAEMATNINLPHLFVVLELARSTLESHGATLLWAPPD
jgi:hypothetical protein